MNVLVLTPNPIALPSLRMADYILWSDAQLVVACQERQPIAFECLRKRYLRIVAAILIRLAPERKDLDDLLQDIFIRVWKSIKSLRNPLAFKAWLNRIIRNCFYDELRAAPDKSMVYLDAPFAGENQSSNPATQIADHGALPEELAESKEMSGEIQAGLAKLPSMGRQLILLRFDGRTYEDMASITKTELGTVKSRLFRARTKLKALMTLNNESVVALARLKATGAAFGC